MNKKVLEKLRDCCRREAEARKQKYQEQTKYGINKSEKAEEEIHLMFLAAKCFEKILQGAAPPEVQQTLFDIKEYDKPKRTYDVY